MILPLRVPRAAKIKYTPARNSVPLVLVPSYEHDTLLLSVVVAACCGRLVAGIWHQASGIRHLATWNVGSANNRSLAGLSALLCSSAPLLPSSSLQLAHLNSSSPSPLHPPSLSRPLSRLTLCWRPSCILPDNNSRSRSNRPSSANDRDCRPPHTPLLAPRPRRIRPPLLPLLLLLLLLPLRTRTRTRSRTRSSTSGCITPSAWSTARITTLLPPRLHPRPPPLPCFPTTPSPSLLHPPPCPSHPPT